MRMDKKAIYSRLEKIRNLPTLPAVVNRLGTEVRNSRSDAVRIAAIIEDDPSMMARILKVVNSVFYASAEPITSVQQAVARMGLTAINNVALSTSVFSTFEKDDKAEFNREAFWRHSISTGIAAGVLHDQAGERLSRRYPSDLLHLAGLLHDIGKIVFEQFFTKNSWSPCTTARNAISPCFRLNRNALAWITPRQGPGSEKNGTFRIN